MDKALGLVVLLSAAPPKPSLGDLHIPPGRPHGEMFGDSFAALGRKNGDARGFKKYLNVDAISTLIFDCLGSVFGGQDGLKI